MSKQKNLIATIKDTIDNLEIREEGRKNRLYIPRSDLELPVSDVFRSLTKTEQEKVMKNYKRSHKN